MLKYLVIRYTFFLILLFFSFWLMWHTLSYDTTTHNILISAKYWSDFGSHLPQIRSFSLGSNWPPQSPLFPGEPTRYHFLFYFVAGIFERLGMPIDWALNLNSAIGFFLLTIMIWLFTYRLFTSRLTAYLSVIFFLFNSSLSWLDYLKSNNFNLISSISNLASLTQFPSFGPWNGSAITAFWNLNIYTNHRHLLYLFGFIAGSLVLLNQAALAIVALFAASYFIFQPKLRTPLLLSAVGAVPWLFFSRLISNDTSQLAWYLGFLTKPPVIWSNFLRFWFLNIGLHLVFIPSGFLMAPKQARKLIFPLLVLFIAPNLIKFSTDIINNHKFFNFFLIIGSMFTAYVLVKIKPLLLLLPLLVLGGIVDFFPVKNDFYFHLPDITVNPDAQYFQKNTLPDSIVLNSTWFYHPASLAGRKIFNGYSYFTCSFGYDQATREYQALAIYRAPDSITACRLLHRNNISFVYLNNRPENFIFPNWNLWKNNFSPQYHNPTTGVSIYNVSHICPAT